MIRITARNTDHTLIRVLNYIVVSALNISVKVTSNSILIELRYHTMILLTLVALYNAAFLRVDINVVILII